MLVPGGLPLRPLAVAAVLIESREPAKLAAFYRDLLGLPLQKVRPAGEAAHFACEVGSVYLAIKRGRRSGGGSSIAFMVEDVKGAVRALGQAGVRVRAPKRTALGLIARFEDPEGNPVELYQP